MVEAESHTPEEYQEKNDDRLARVYLVHHMHHFLRNGEIEHELHHCFLYTGKNFPVFNMKYVIRMVIQQAYKFFG